MSDEQDKSETKAHEFEPDIPDNPRLCLLCGREVNDYEYHQPSTSKLVELPEELQKDIPVHGEFQVHVKTVFGEKVFNRACQTGRGMFLSSIDEAIAQGIVVKSERFDAVNSAYERVKAVSGAGWDKLDELRQKARQAMKKMQEQADIEPDSGRTWPGLRAAHEMLEEIMRKEN